jgi:putative transposase
MPILITRPVPGVIKQVVLKFTRTHKWFVSVISRTPDEPIIREGMRTVGIDMNLVNFSTDTDGKVFEHPHNVKKAARQLGRAQRKMSRKIRGSHNRRKQRLKVTRIHETVENRRDDFLHKWSNHYVQNYDRISVEKLNIKDMLEGRKSRGMNRNTLDAAWGKARTFLTYKAKKSWLSIRCSRFGIYNTRLFPVWNQSQKGTVGTDTYLSVLRLHCKQGFECRLQH